MRQGLEWYKREPRAFLEGVRAARMTTRQIVVYSLVLDLIYDHGGETPDDPKHIASYVSDISAAVVRTTIQQLVDMGKLFRVGDMLHQKRAENEAKTRRNLSETRAEIGYLGGVSSGVSRSRSNENKGLVEANALSKHEAEKEKEKEKDKKEAKASLAQRASRLPVDWFLPRDWGEWALFEGMTRDQVKAQSETFKDYWIAKAGRDATKADWQATWRNWCRKFIADQGKGKANGRQPSINAAFGAAINQLADDLTAGRTTIDNSRSDPFAVRSRGHA